MAVEGRYWTWTVAAGEHLDDLTPGAGSLFKAVDIRTGKLATDGRYAGGILVFCGCMGEHVTLGYAGIMKFTAGESIPAGEHLTVGIKKEWGISRPYAPCAEGRGFFMKARPGDYVVGRCLDSGVAEGSIGTGAFNFATVSYLPANS